MSDIKGLIESVRSRAAYERRGSKGTEFEYSAAFTAMLMERAADALEVIAKDHPVFNLNGDFVDAVTMVRSCIQTISDLQKRIAITDEMVERAAKELERDAMSGYGWSDEQFEIWWNKDWHFCEAVNMWSGFRGTKKAKCLREARIVLTAARKASE